MSRHLDVPANLARYGEGEEQYNGYKVARREVGIEEEAREEADEGISEEVSEESSEEDMITRAVTDTIVRPVMLLCRRI